MPQILDAVRIGELYNIDGFNYRAVGYCLSGPNEKRKVLLIATAINYAPHKPKKLSPLFRSKKENGKPKRKNNNPPLRVPIRLLKLKLTENEVLDRAAQTAENRAGGGTSVQGCGIPIAMRWHNFRPRS